MLLIDRATVRELYPVPRALPVMAEAMRRYSRGQVDLPLRTVLRPEKDTGLLGTMPGFVAGDDLAGYGLKAMVLKPDNPARGLELHIGVVMVFDPGTGAPLALMDAGAVTAVRTAAVSAVATEALALPDAGDLAVLGSGVQARSHLEAMSLVRPLRRVRVWSRTREHAEAYRVWAATELGIQVETVSTPAQALAGADLVCTTTAAKEPVVQASDLAPGVHVNAVGASFVDHRELSSQAVAGASFFVDSRESALAESGDLRAPLTDGLVGPDHIRAELGEVLLGTRPGRREDTETTVFKSLGLGVQDIMSGFAIAEEAAVRGLGRTFELD
ncbi:ornithine cyclodeaminase/alanine dehydrogenase-like protein (mu-crystallin family) [Streptomyces sp. LBL]|uniref:ornithine cyclodeaminase family protein n=1 Tax=Streptomyces sp. LBL TaxID=2940562 RepID=UPI002474D529|nr:ornithine cyclodeaminase family protein [Streptomyces sp. LBL]MDH6623200.1 ornithine cyclodeaminase/alanine dehydrogenase-like protein (mu-crystallin family) [Streptomyces sp. LBL]